MALCRPRREADAGRRLSEQRLTWSGCTARRRVPPGTGRNRLRRGKNVAIEYRRAEGSYGHGLNLRLAGASITVTAGNAKPVTPVGLDGRWWEWSGHGRRPDAPPLSIVVLPFANQSNDPEQDYFVDAITDDLTTDLSRIDGSFVIARTTAFTYK